MQNVLVQTRVRTNHSGNAAGTRFDGQGKRVLPMEEMYIHKSIDGQTMVKVSTGDVWPVEARTGIFDGKPYSYVTVAE